MVYPNLTYGSVSGRCQSDIDAFVKLQEGRLDSTGIVLWKGDGVPTKSILEAKLASILEKLPKDDYVNVISSIDAKTAEQYWIARTYLFYQMLIIATALFNNEALYNEIMSEQHRSEYPYRADVPSELTHFKIGIFGSMTPTSDIDVGVQYGGQTLKTPALAYIVSTFESLFPVMTSRSSLTYDIETYADIITLSIDGLDYFYLNSIDFTLEDFKRVLPYAGNSIQRNMQLSHNHTGVAAALNTFRDVVKFIGKEADFLKIGETDKPLYDALNDPAWFEQSKKDMNEFLQKPYDAQRYDYYKKVSEMETTKFQKTVGVENLCLSASDVCDIMVKLGSSDSYRMESYTCAPTIIHVVRILQERLRAPEKYKTIAIEECKAIGCREGGKIPMCSIGSYGYMLSILEQVGYMCRFKLDYCMQPTPDPVKCKKKLDKYGSRYDDAFDHYKSLTAKRGGDARKKRRNTRRRRGTFRKTKSVSKRRRRQSTSGRTSKRLRRKTARASAN